MYRGQRRPGERQRPGRHPDAHGARRPRHPHLRRPRPGAPRHREHRRGVLCGAGDATRNSRKRAARGLRVWHRSAALAALMLGRTGHRGHRHARQDHHDGDDGRPARRRRAPTRATSSARRWPTPAGPTTSAPATPFVVEADESDGSFRQYPAQVVVITNVEADHLDNWGTAEAYAAGFVALAVAEPVQVVVISADDPGAVALTPAIRAAGKRVVTFGTADDADVRISGASFPAGRCAGDPDQPRTTAASSCWPCRAPTTCRTPPRPTPSDARSGCPASGCGRPPARSAAPSGASRLVAERRRRPDLRRLRPPPDGGGSDAHRCPRPRRGRPARRLLPAAPVHPDARLRHRVRAGTRPRGRDPRARHLPVAGGPAARHHRPPGRRRGRRRPPPAGCTTSRPLPRPLRPSQRWCAPATSWSPSAPAT